MSGFQPEVGDASSSFDTLHSLFSRTSGCSPEKTRASRVEEIVHMAELVDALVPKTSIFGCVSSSLTMHSNLIFKLCPCSSIGGAFDF